MFRKSSSSTTIGNANPICTLGDYSRPSHEGYRNSNELLKGNNVVPLRSETIRLVQNGCSFHGLRSEDQNQHLKDFLKLVDSLDLDVANRERIRLSLFQFSLRDQASNWLECLPAGSISTGEDLTTRSLAQFFPPERTAKLRNDILMFQQHQGETLSLKRGLDLALYDNESWNDPRDFAKPVKAISLPHDVQKTIYEKLDAQMNFVSTDYPIKEELRGKGIKSPSKLLSPKYLSQSSLAEQNRNTSYPKRIHFVNSIIILNKEDEAKEEGSVKSSVTKNEDRKMTFESKEEFEEETEEETEEEEEDNPKHFDTFSTMKELGYHEWLLKNPRPPWVKAKIRTENLNNIKFSYMIGHFYKKQAYLDMESPINGLKVFIGNFTYEYDFMVLKDTTSVIDHELGSVVFGKPFVEATGLVYDMKEGTIMFEKDKEKIVFKMPHKMEMFNLIDFTDIKTDRIPPFVIKGDDDKSEKNPLQVIFDEKKLESS
ncbi:MAK10-like protein [Tanacetum coccineum]